MSIFVTYILTETDIIQHAYTQSGIHIYHIYVYFGYKFNRPHDPFDMTNDTKKYYTMT